MSSETGPRPPPSSLTRWAAVLAGQFGPRDVDLLGQLGHAGQHGDPGGEPRQRPVPLGEARRSLRARVDLHEPSVHGEPGQGAVGLLDPHLAGHDVADQRRVAVEHREGALGGRQDDRGGTAGEQGLLGRDDLHAEDAVGH